MIDIKELRRAFIDTSIEVKDSHLCITRLLSGHYNQADADFIAIAVKYWPRLVDIAEAASSLLSETGMKELVLAYVRGMELIELLIGDDFAESNA